MHVCVCRRMYRALVQVCTHECEHIGCNLVPRPFPLHMSFPGEGGRGKTWERDVLRPRVYIIVLSVFLIKCTLGFTDYVILLSEKTRQ